MYVFWGFCCPKSRRYLLLQCRVVVKSMACSYKRTCLLYTQDISVDSRTYSLAVMATQPPQVRMNETHAALANVRPVKLFTSSQGKWRAVAAASYAFGSII